MVSSQLSRAVSRTVRLWISLVGDKGDRMDSPILRFVICTILIIAMVIVTYYYRKHVVKPMKFGPEVSKQGSWTMLQGATWKVPIWF